MNSNQDRDQLSRLGEAGFPNSSVRNESVPIEEALSDAGIVDNTPRIKFNYLGAPAIFRLQLACQQINRAFPGQCYIVGSVLKGPAFRDVDIRMIMDDADFRVVFPDVHSSLGGHWENDPRWLLMTSWASEYLSFSMAISKPVDFQFQPQSWNLKHHKGEARHPIGYFYAPEEKE